MNDKIQTVNIVQLEEANLSPAQAHLLVEATEELGTNIRGAIKNFIVKYEDDKDFVGLFFNAMINVLAHELMTLYEGATNEYGMGPKLFWKSIWEAFVLNRKPNVPIMIFPPEGAKTVTSEDLNAMGLNE